MTRAPNACASLATALPIRPTPISPTVFVASSEPIVGVHFPDRIFESVVEICRNEFNICAMVSSATAWVGASGVLNTSIPNRLAACKSTLSSPVPHRAITRNDFALDRTRSVSGSRPASIAITSVATSSATSSSLSRRP